MSRRPGGFAPGLSAPIDMLAMHATIALAQYPNR